MTAPLRRAYAAGLLVAVALAATGCARTAVPAPAPPPATDRVHLLVLNGGGRPEINFQSHLLHVRQLLDLADQAGIDPQRITVFASDGADPGADLAVRLGNREAAWRLAGTPLFAALRPVRYADSTLPGFTLQPATRAALDAWFAGPARRLRAGDVLLLYVTDHGERNPADPADNTITLWGEGETLSVTALRALLAGLDPGVRVVALMSQCFSGSFAGIATAHTTAAGLPAGATCGYFSSTRNRPAYGCYPENLGRENVGHSFDFFQGLAASGSFPAAHAHTLVEDATPDVPLRTSELFLQEQLQAEARRRGVPLWQFADELLAEAWRDRGRHEAEIRLLDRIGEAFGFFSPRSLAELREQKSRLPQISAHLARVATAWKSARGDANRAALQDLLAAEPFWNQRLADANLRALDPETLEALGAELLDTLAARAVLDPAAEARLQELHARGEAAAAAAYRMEVRLAAVLRMRMVLLGVAGRTWLERHADAAARDAWAALLACEDAVRLPAGLTLPALAAHEPFPPFDADVARATAAMPAWMGIRFRAVADEERAALGLAAGAAQVVTVYPDSPAAAAGLEVGDILLGPPQAPFAHPREVRAWTMLSPIGAERRLALLRGGRPLEVGLVPATFPLEWPSLPGPPAVGTTAPPLRLLPYRGDATRVVGRPHLLFFWATWCPPCKAAVPRLLEIEAAGIPVVAITDEPRETLDAYFARAGAFPAIVAIDDLRRTHQAWGISGTPTFAFIGADGTVLQTSTGFDAARGLPLPPGLASD